MNTVAGSKALKMRKSNRRRRGGAIVAALSWRSGLALMTASAPLSEQITGSRTGAPPIYSSEVTDYIFGRKSGSPSCREAQCCGLVAENQYVLRVPEPLGQ